MQKIWMIGINNKAPQAKNLKIYANNKGRSRQQERGKLYYYTIMVYAILGPPQAKLAKIGCYLAGEFKANKNWMNLKKTDRNSKFFKKEEFFWKRGKEEIISKKRKFLLLEDFWTPWWKAVSLQPCILHEIFGKGETLNKLSGKKF